MSYFDKFWEENDVGTPSAQYVCLKNI